MRVITNNASNAFAANKSFSGNNTVVTVNSDSVNLYLFGKHIATKDANGAVRITNAGWPTVTTVDRLRGIGANVNLAGGKRGVQRSATMYLNGKPMVNGAWYDIDFQG